MTTVCYVAVQVTQLGRRHQSLLLESRDRLQKYTKLVEVQSEFDELRDAMQSWLESAFGRYDACTSSVGLDDTEVYYLLFVC